MTRALQLTTIKKVFLGVLIAFTLWSLMFSPWTKPAAELYWPSMAGSAIILLCYATLFGKWWQGVKFHWTDILLGIGIAAGLWGVFWVGDKLSQLMFSFARPQVDNVYSLRDGGNQLYISLLLLFLIGPTEEIFWRGYVQRKLTERLIERFPGTFSWCKRLKRSSVAAFVITTTAYTLIHLFSFNFMLIMAALVCGVVWGGLYCFWPKRFPAIVLSHCLWDAAVFIWFPIF